MEVSLLAFLVLHAALVLGQGDNGKGASPGIITLQNGQFVDSACIPFVFSGANVGQLLESGAGVSGSTSDVSSLFSIAKSNGLNVIRFFPQGITPSLQLQTAPGQYDQKALQALDSIISQATDAGVKVIIPFVNNWEYQEGKLQYVNWGGGDGPESFYTDANVKSLYKAHVKFLTSRVNSLTGRKYAEEPSIFAYNLINEPRAACNVSAQNASCLPAATENIQAWIEEMSGYVKQQDPNHLLTVGEEGFFAASDAANAKGYNPNYDGMPNNWQANASYCTGGTNPSCGPEFVANWINSHAVAAKSLKKPLIVEEFGTGPEARNDIFGTIYDAYTSSVSTSGNLKGVAFWEWEWIEKSGNQAKFSSPMDWVRTGDMTWTLQVQPSLASTQQFLAKAQPVPNCLPGNDKASGLLPVASYSTTGRRLLTAARNESMFATAGTSLEASHPGELLDHTRCHTLHNCAHMCESLPGCDAFNFAMPQGSEGLNCQLWTSPRSKEVQWSNAGYQTFWRHQA